MKPNKVRPIAVCVFRDGDRIFIAEGYDPVKEKAFYRQLGGTIEFGERGYETVVREVWEEAGVRVGEVDYVASQPWPFPYSLMLGFTARADSYEINVDGEEIQEARWFSREELRRAFETGEVLPPSGISIAARLVERWYGEPLPRPAA